jgi:hypothetical protein
MKVSVELILERSVHRSPPPQKKNLKESGPTNFVLLSTNVINNLTAEDCDVKREKNDNFNSSTQGLTALTQATLQSYTWLHFSLSEI